MSIVENENQDTAASPPTTDDENENADSTPEEESEQTKAPLSNNTTHPSIKNT